MAVEHNCLLNADLHSITPEFKNALSFLKKHPNLETWPSCIPYVKSVDDVLRLRSSEAGSQLVDAITIGEGKPVIISDAATTWPASSTWTIDYLRQKSSSSSISVRVNNRAPARHADMLPGGGGQQSIQLSLTEYLNYMDHMPDSLDKIDLVNCNTPFYLNGWRAFEDIPLLSRDFPALPEFSTSVDDTLALLAALDAQLFKSLQQPAASCSEDSIVGWCHQVDRNLKKLFICPPGSLTRLHYDAGSAHGWLAQIKGRKLFILYPPSDTHNMYPLETEIETVQSPIDPLCPDAERWPNIKNAHPVACIVQPGEAVVIPQGWWHYAIALDKSITLQRNFYHAGSNAAGLVQMVLKTAASLKTNGGRGGGRSSEK
jgi:chloride channel 7